MDRQPRSRPGGELKDAISLILLSISLQQGNRWRCCMLQQCRAWPKVPRPHPADRSSHLPVQLISCTLEQGDDSPDGFICRERPHVISSPCSKPHTQMLCLDPRKNSLSNASLPPSLQNPFQPIAKCLVILSQHKHPPAFEILSPHIKP